MLGDKKLSLVPVAVSLMTSCTSALTLLGNSAELYYQGSSYAWLFVSILLSGPITAYTVLPVFYRLNELSLYQVSPQQAPRWQNLLTWATFANCSPFSTCAGGLACSSSTW